MKSPAATAGSVGPTSPRRATGPTAHTSGTWRSGAGLAGGLGEALRGGAATLVGVRGCRGTERCPVARLDGTRVAVEERFKRPPPERREEQSPRCDPRVPDVGAAPGRRLLPPAHLRGLAGGDWEHTLRDSGGRGGRLVPCAWGTAESRRSGVALKFALRAWGTPGSGGRNERVREAEGANDGKERVRGLGSESEGGEPC